MSNDFNVDDYMGMNDTLGTPTDGGGVDLSSFFGDDDVNLFDGVDMESLPEDPYSLPKNTYRWRVISIDLKPTRNDPNKLGMLLKYAIADGAYRNRQTQEWFHYPNPKDGSTEEERVKAFALLKNLLTALGLDEDQRARFNHKNYKQLDGAEFYCNAGSVPKRDTPEYKEIRLFGNKIPVGGAGTDGINPWA